MIDHEGSVSTQAFHQRMVENDHRIPPPDIMMVPDNAELTATVEHSHETTALEQNPVEITDHESRRIGMMMRDDNDVESTSINKQINHNIARYMIVEAILDKDEDGYSDVKTNSKGNKKVRELQDTPGKTNIIYQQKQPDVVHVVASNRMNAVLSSSSTRSHHDGDDAVNQKQQQIFATAVHHTVLSQASHSLSPHKEVDQELVKQSYDHIDLKTGGESVSDPCIVKLQDGPYVSNSGNTDNLLSATTNSNYNSLRNGKRSKVRYDATNGIIPGAVRVVGCRRSVDDSESQSSNVIDGTNQDNNHEMESSSRNEDVYHGELAPVELLEKVDAVPWEDPQKRKTSKRNSENERQRLPIKQGLVKLLLLVLFLFVISATVIIAIWCGNRKLKTTSTAATTSSGSDNNTQPNVITYKPFETKQELVDAIEQFLSGQNRTSVEGTYGNLSLWNVSQIEDFSYLFSPFTRHLLNTKFNEDVSSWDVSCATNMSYMFYGAQDFRGDISNWNVSRVTDVQYFMSQAYKFNGNLSKWDTSKFLNTSYMFYDAIDVSGFGLENWNVANVYDMTGMFSSSFDCYYTQNEFSYCKNASKFDGNLSNWDVSNVRSMANMFHYASSFRGVGLGNWNTNKIENVNSMFAFASSFDANLSLWDMSNVNDASSMFYVASSFQGAGVENWNTSKIETMYAMFNMATSFDANLALWDMSNVNDASWMFFGALSFQGAGVENWNTSNIETMGHMFQVATSFDANLSLWDMSNVKDTSFMFFNGASSFMHDASSFRGVGVENWNTSKIETMNTMFASATSFDANLSSWDMSNVKDTSWMFAVASSFQGVGVENWNTSMIVTMSSMFSSATFFDANLSLWDVSRVSEMSNMFWNASSFHGTGLNEWNTISVQYTSGTFGSATSFDTNLSNWDVSKVVDMTGMFQNAIAFHGNGLDLWNISQVNKTAYMFLSDVSFNADLSRWDISNLENATDMFENATSFEGVFWWNDTFANNVEYL